MSRPAAYPPTDVRSERALLGAILIDPEAIRVAAAIVQIDDISHAQLRPIFEAMVALHRRGVPTDYVLVGGELDDRGAMDAIGGERTLTSLINECTTSVHTEHFARRLADVGRRRRAQQAPNYGRTAVPL